LLITAAATDHLSIVDDATANSSQAGVFDGGNGGDTAAVILV